MARRFSGTYTALVTPFTSDGQIDWKAFDLLVRKQLDASIDGIVILGTTGEAATVHAEEVKALLCRARELAGECLVVIAGISGNDTLSTVRQAKIAEMAGVDGILVTCPYYNKPSQRGLILHYQAVAASVKTPILLYNIKGRTGINIEIETTLQLAKVPNIVGIKESSSEMDHVLELMSSVPDGFAVLAGNDDMALSILALGGDGVISTLSNLLPIEVKKIIDAMVEGRYQEALEVHNYLLPLMRGCMLETNPIPIKTALAWRGDISPIFRLPMTAMQEIPASKWRYLLESHGIIQVGFASNYFLEA